MMGLEVLNRLGKSFFLEDYMIELDELVVVRIKIEICKF